MAALSTAGRNAACNAIVALLNAGGAGSFILTTVSGGTGTTLATITLNNPAFGAAAAGVCTLIVSPALSDASADASGVAAGWALRNNAAATIIGGSIGVGAEDLDIDNASIVATQVVNLNAIAITAPG